MRDADIAEESSNYIRYQILQQASSTLLASSRNLKAGNILGLLSNINQ
jgi:flagellin-like hook-associated protein FlgL